MKIQFYMPTSFKNLHGVKELSPTAHSNIAGRFAENVAINDVPDCLSCASTISVCVVTVLLKQ